MRSLLLVLLVAGCGSDPVDPLVVSTTAGDVRGRAGDGVRAFLGIPYAAPPVGELRWRPPQPIAPWSGVREATERGSMCAQNFNFVPGGGDEDCLYLNVWTPEDANGAPVLLWLHGGAFVFGSGGETYYDGAHLARTFGVVVVTVNYRVNVFGFLAHPELTAEDPAYPSSGNYGLEDQFVAMTWVHDNIRAFGGDPDGVLLFGESAGGYSVCEHYLAPRSAGLFAYALAESGACSPAQTEPTLAGSEQNGVAFAAGLGCADLACLRALSTQQLLDAAAPPALSAQATGGPFYQAAAATDFWPNVDGHVIAAPMRDAFAAGGFAPRPFLMGTNRDEGALLHASIIARPVADEAEYRAALARRFGATAADAIVAEYPVADFASANDALVNVTTDSAFVCPARRTARVLAAAGAPVWLYSFEAELEHPVIDDAGTFHTAELPFVFGNDTFPLGRMGASGLELSAALQGYWVRFARTGDPNGDGALAWPAYDQAGDQHLRLATPLGAGRALKAARCDFWDAYSPE